MNRLQSVELSLDTRQSSCQQRFEFNAPLRAPLPSHQFFIPLHYEKNYAYPLFIWLHGPGGCEQEIDQVMPHVSVRNYVGLALRGVVKDTVVDSNGDETYTWDQGLANIEFAVDDLLRCIEHAQSRFHISKRRIFLVGNDVGGTMALRLATLLPDVIAGVASLGGPFPSTHTPLSGLVQARSLPVFFAHCRDSQVYDVEHACSDLRLLYSAGFGVTLRQYPCPQEVTTQMLADVNAWIMGHVCGQSVDSSVIDDPTHLRLEEHN